MRESSDWPWDEPAPSEAPKHDCNIVSLSGIEPRSVEWLWPDRIPLGMFSLLAGNPGVGKSTIAFTIAAIVSNGGKWPFSDQSAEPSEVIILTSEDDAQYTIVPRLIAAGADRSRIHMIQSVMRPHEETVVDAPLLLSKDMHQLHGALEQYPDTRLMIFDPISAYLGVRDSHRDSDVRQVLGPLTNLAARHGVAVLGITHLNKAAGSSAIARFMGSTGIIAAARSAYMALKHEDQLLFLPVKSNVARDDVGGLVYQIEGTRIQEEIETSRIEWTGTTDQDVNEILREQQARQRSPQLTTATEFLEDQLSQGPKRQVEIEKAAKEAEISFATVRRAKKQMKAHSHKDLFTGGWKWYTKGQWELKIEQETPRR